MLSAREVMSVELVAIDRAATVESAALLLKQKSVGSLLVTSAGYPVGIITEKDIVLAVADKKPLKETAVETVMSSPLYAVTPDTNIFAIASTMTANKIKKLPVMERQKILGIVTQTDIVRVVLETVRELEHQYRHGHIGAQEFAIKTGELFSSVPRLSDAPKEWHMKCLSCGKQFLNAEINGALRHQSCPLCKGTIEYDHTPPV